MNPLILTAAENPSTSPRNENGWRFVARDSGRVRAYTTTKTHGTAVRDRHVDWRGGTGVKMARLSCPGPRSIESRLGLSLIAYNLRNLWRRLALPQRIGNWSLTSLQPR